MPSRAARLQRQLAVLEEEKAAGRLSEAARLAFVTIASIIAESLDDTIPTQSSDATSVPPVLLAAASALTAGLQ